MALPIHPPFPPMEALSVDEVPTGAEWQYEPKWDGFRCIAFRDGAKIELQSKAGQPLARYFPEVVEHLTSLKAKTFVLDGELAIPAGGAFSFDDLLLRLHPAESRVRKLAAASPAIYIVFDLLVDPEGKSLIQKTLRERRSALERFARAGLRGCESIRLSPATVSIDEARGWLKRVGATLDGIIAKRLDMAYCSGTREGMQKIKNYRSADCVVGGFRYGTGKKVVGSLLLGLVNDAGKLDHVGFTSTIKASEREAITKKLERLIKPPGFSGRAPGGPSRWNAGKNTEWQPLAPCLVVEVSYDHFTGGRFRHGTKLLRWRPDKAPEQCTFAQVEQKRANLLQLLP
ncbi:MAG TPA: ATP-dependent DNA ligase [Chthoniobacteraceae bacterium]|nr:ATP-dependent DNA ligase [Chthoniobacteraceae bacterium]